MNVDDVIFMCLNPMQYICIMEYEYHFKGVGVPKYYLGGNMELGKDGKLSRSAKTYIKNVADRLDKCF